jgi:predicted DNA-binding WGR domain protein
VHLEFHEGTSAKFWRARLDGRSLYINYGRVGSTGQTQPKDFPSPDVARQELDKLEADKRRKGYVDVGGAARAAAVHTGADIDEDEVDDDREPDDEDDDDVPSMAPAVRTARPPASLRLVLERRVEAYISVEGNTVRMVSVERCASPDAAKQAYERLEKWLAAEGYQKG